MTTTRNLLGFIVAASLAALLAGCGKTPDTTSQAAESPVVASPTTCAEVGKVTDPAQKAALLEKCGLGGPKFKPSPKKEY